MNWSENSFRNKSARINFFRQLLAIERARTEKRVRDISLFMRKVLIHSMILMLAVTIVAGIMAHIQLLTAGMWFGLFMFTCWVAVGILVIVAGGRKLTQIAHLEAELKRISEEKMAEEVMIDCDHHDEGREDPKE